MSATRSPAATLLDLVVTNEQTRAQWRAGSASIESGRIVVPTKATPPSSIVDSATSTFTIIATDGGGRARRFDDVKVDEVSSKRIVFV
ncbi:MAG TPA: hypothetical protein VGR02_06845 [Thermoanaerobaculia bacterium]|jgi:hypothetical protein|nr:hypothetical protein [Thermoanaerobaculia bacterium]